MKFHGLKLSQEHLLPWVVTIISYLHVSLITLIPGCHGHGRLIEPPSRASAWRYGFQTPPNYNDHELYCGGFARQWNKNEGKCGECGDAWDTPLPRAHEFGGKWGQGLVVRKYNPESDISLRVELTASHMGYFEFRVCPDVKAKQDCLDKYVLKIVSGSPSFPAPTDLDTRFYPRNGSRIYEIKAKLPAGLKCDACVLQWRYIAGNNWGLCEDGSGAVGCGPQEEFRACSDIFIGETGRTTMRPFRPTTKTSAGPTTTTVKVPEYPEAGTGEEGEFWYIGILIVFLSLVGVLCLLASLYLYHYHGQRVKQILRWKRNKETASTAANNNQLNSEANGNDGKLCDSIITPAPVAPPRTKRLSNVKEISPDESSVVLGESSLPQDASS